MLNPLSYLSGKLESHQRILLCVQSQYIAIAFGARVEGIGKVIVEFMPVSGGV